MAADAERLPFADHSLRSSLHGCATRPVTRRGAWLRRARGVSASIFLLRSYLAALRPLGYFIAELALGQISDNGDRDATFPPRRKHPWSFRAPVAIALLIAGAGWGRTVTATRINCYPFGFDTALRPNWRRAAVCNLPGLTRSPDFGAPRRAVCPPGPSRPAASLTYRLPAWAAANRRTWLSGGARRARPALSGSARCCRRGPIQLGEDRRQRKSAGIRRLRAQKRRGRSRALVDAQHAVAAARAPIAQVHLRLGMATLRSRRAWLRPRKARDPDLPCGSRC